MRGSWLGALLLCVGCQLLIDASPDDLVEDTFERCHDQVDNDGDLAIDCQDTECAAFCSDCLEDAATLCFLPSQDIALQGSPLALKSAQLNDDNNLDFVVTTNANQLELLFGDGAAFVSAQALSTGGFPISLDTGDANNDGATDIVVAAQGDDRLNVFFGDGTGAFSAPLNLITQSAPSSVLFADLNNDARADVVTTCEGSGDINSFLAQANDTFSGVSSDNSPQGPNSIAAAFLNGDGFLDIVSANFQDRSLHVFLNDLTGRLNPAATIFIGAVLESVLLLDVNGDGLPDAITAASDQAQVQVSLSDGAGGFLAQQDIPLAGTVFGHHTLIAQDLNSDGLVDLIVQTTGLQAQLFLGDGTGAFVLAASLSVDGSAITVGDFNNDGKVDVAVADKAQPQVRLFLRQP